MKKNFIKKMVCMFVIVFVAFQIAGCTDNKEKVSNSSNGNSEYFISDEPIELTMFFRASKTEDGQWDLMKDAAEKTNVFAKSIVSKSNSDMTQAFNLMLASGDIADLVFVQDDVQFIKYGIEGAFVPLNKHFDKMPNFKKFLDENPDVKKRVTASDGNIYYTPFEQAGTASTGWFVRKDWLDKVGLDIPKTAEDMYEVLTAFKNSDPNGNGKQDEVPFYSQDRLEALFPLWGSRQDWYIEDGKIGYGPIEPEYKVAMENIIKWYNEGLIDKEITTRTTSPRDKFLMDNIGGMTHDWFGSTAAFNDKLLDEIPGFSLIPIEPIEGIELNRRVTSNYGWGVYTGSKYVDEAIKFVDFWYSEEGNRMINFGKEGFHWNLVDGKPKFTDTVLNAENPQQLVREYGCQIGIGFVQDFDYEKQWLNQTAIEGMEMYDEGNWYAEQMPPVYMHMSPDESEEYKKLLTQVETYTDEIFQKWILGAESFEDTYDDYLTQVEKLGISRLLELQQIACDRYMAN